MWMHLSIQLKSWLNDDMEQCDTIEEVNMNGSLINNFKFMPTIPLCSKTYQLLTI